MIPLNALLITAKINTVLLLGAIVCTTIVNRLEGDQLTTPKSELVDWEKRPFQLVIKYVKQNL